MNQYHPSSSSLDFGINVEQSISLEIKLDLLLPSKILALVSFSKRFFIQVVLGIITIGAFGCDPEVKDTPNGDDSSNEEREYSSINIEVGVQQAYIKGTTSAPFGFYLYVPLDYDATTDDLYPLLIHLHGGGARGNSAQNPNDLNQILFDGPPKLIAGGQWSPSHPMIVASPQSPTIWNVDHLHEFITYLIEELKVNSRRIYMTGLSMGGKGCFDYVSTKGVDAYVAAIVPIAGWGNTSDREQFKSVATWAFHGDKDQVISFSSSVNMIEAINNAGPQVPAKLTVYSGVGHDSWTRTYDGSGMGEESEDYDPFEENIFDWMYLFEKKQ